KKKLPFHIPVAVGLLDSQGRDMPLVLSGAAPQAGANGQGSTTLVRELTEASQTFRLTGIPAKPVPSLLRNFSAPVVLEYDYSDEALAFLMAHDSDPFNRWEAGQRLATARLLGLAAAASAGNPLEQAVPGQAAFC